MSCWGLMAEFDSAAALVAAARAARTAGYAPEAHSPFHIEGLAETLGIAASPIAAITFGGAFVGGVGSYALQWYSAVIDRPLNVGGRPLNSWPMFVPSCFEIMILFGAIAAVLAFLWTSGLPKLHHPLFGAEEFTRATRDRFFLVLRSDDPAFELGRSRDWLNGLQPLRCVEVPA